MADPDYLLRNANANVKLDGAKEHLEQALHDDEVKPETKIYLLRALRQVTEAQSYLLGGNRAAGV